MKQNYKKGRAKMYGFISGITDTDDISYCPKCGGRISGYRADGTADCDGCGYHFGVVECEDSEEAANEV